jgi:hypothetical protein
VKERARPARNGDGNECKATSKRGRRDDGEKAELDFEPHKK